VTNFAAANVDSAEVVEAFSRAAVVTIDADGVYDLAPGEYIAFGVFDGEQATADVPFAILACATTPPGDDPGTPTTPTTPATLPPTDTVEGAVGGTNVVPFIVLFLAVTSLGALALTPKRR
jgi:hypothetical protein